MHKRRERDYTHSHTHVSGASEPPLPRNMHTPNATTNRAISPCAVIAPRPLCKVSSSPAPPLPDTHAHKEYTHPNTHMEYMCVYALHTHTHTHTHTHLVGTRGLVGTRVGLTVGMKVGTTTTTSSSSKRKHRPRSKLRHTTLPEWACGPCRRTCNTPLKTSGAFVCVCLRACVRMCACVPVRVRMCACRPCVLSRISVTLYLGCCLSQCVSGFLLNVCLSVCVCAMCVCVLWPVTIVRRQLSGGWASVLSNGSGASLSLVLSSGCVHECLRARVSACTVHA